MTDSPTPQGSLRRRPRWRTLAFHLTALVVVLFPLMLAEMLLRLWVAAPETRWDDPYVTFSNPSPLFVADATGAQFETAPNRLVAFRRQSFAARKPPDTFRVFCLGGSTVQGRPYSVETAFATWLQLGLEAARPERRWEVINCGGISYASYRLVPIVRELLSYEPDLFILYTGHNEFLEDRTYAHVKEVPRILVRLHRVMLGLRSYALADRWLANRNRRRAAPTVMGPEVQTKLDLAAGLDAYRRDPTWHRSIIAHFSHNLNIMAQMAQDAGIPMILVNPVVNLKDCPPFKSEFRTDLSAGDAQQVRDLWNRARALDWTAADIHAKIELLEQAAALDSRHAWLLFLIGTGYERMGQWAEAKPWFVRAKDEDICPLRILEPMRGIIHDIATQWKLHLIDVQTMIEARTEDGISGDEWLLDHVHPTIAGHQLIAEALLQTMKEMEWVRPSDGWEARRDGLWQKHLHSLNEAYYAQGIARLKRLKDWSRGRIHQK